MWQGLTGMLGGIAGGIADRFRGSDARPANSFATDVEDD